jgi:pyruvate/2-oxoacid:ferredoxin oxidoreductase beta subunit
VLTPCPKGWFFDPKYTVDFAKLALETRAWVSWEYADGEFSLTYKPGKMTPVKEYLKLQGRFVHLTEKQIDEIQRMIDEEWKYWEEMDRQKRIILPWISAPIPAVAALS